MKAKGTILTREEKDVIALAAFHPCGQYLNLSNAEIGQRLGISATRVKTVIHQACVKLNAHNRIEAVFFALMRREIRLNDAYSLEEIAEIFRAMCPEMSSRIMSFMREETEHVNLPEENEEIIDTDREDKRQNVILTNCERDVLVLTARGLTNREIADKLYISTHSVKTYLYRVCTKLGARKRAEAVILALKRGETSIDEMFTLDELLQPFTSLEAESLEKVVQLLSQKHEQEPLPTPR